MRYKFRGRNKEGGIMHGNLCQHYYDDYVNDIKAESESVAIWIGRDRNNSDIYSDDVIRIYEREYGDRRYSYEIKANVHFRVCDIGRKLENVDLVSRE